MSALSDEKLVRFWYKSTRYFGVGITAYSREEADQILAEVVERHGLDVEIYDVVTNIDIRNLDQNHVIPNMNPPNYRGVWFPMLAHDAKDFLK